MSGKPQGPAIRRDCPHDGRHQHGTPVAYGEDCCRCDECRAAEAAEARRRYRMLAYGQWDARRHPCGTARRLQALYCLGWSTPKLAAQCGIAEPHLRKLLHGKHQWVITRNHLLVAAMFDRLWDTRPPETTHQERQTASKSRGLARKYGWVPALAWDDLDDPGAVPMVGLSVVVDAVKVDRAIAGRKVQLSRAERTEAIAQLHAAGVEWREIERRLRMPRNTAQNTHTREVAA